MLTTRKSHPKHLINYNNNNNDDDEKKNHRLISSPIKTAFNLPFSISSEDDISIESSHTLTNETLNDPNNPHSQNSKTPNSNEVSSGQSSASLSPSPCNNSISQPSTPLDTPIPTRKNVKTGSMGGHDTKSMNGNAKRKKGNDVSPVREEDTTETDTDSMSGSNRRLKKLSASNVTLTNVCVPLSFIKRFIH